MMVVTFQFGGISLLSSPGLPRRVQVGRLRN